MRLVERQPQILPFVQDDNPDCEWIVAYWEVSAQVRRAAFLPKFVLICANDLGFVDFVGIWDIAESVSCVFSIAV